MLMKRIIQVALVLSSLTNCISWADEWPSKPITLVVPFAAGGTTDILARELGAQLNTLLKQSVIIDNRPGAGGNTAAGMVAKAPNDGYTLFMATIAHAISPGLYSSLNYNFINDFDPIGMVASTPNVLIVAPDLPVKNVKELIAYIKANPGKVNYGSAGSGSTEHLSGALFRSMTGTNITHVPYKGGAPMMTDLIGGQIQMAIETSPSAVNMVKTGKVKALAVTTDKPSKAYPGLPTLSDAGVKGYNVTTWFALMVPHNTPEAIQQKLTSSLNEALKKADLLKKFEEQGVTAGSLRGKVMQDFIKSETDKWSRVAKESGATVN